MSTSEKPDLTQLARALDSMPVEPAITDSLRRARTRAILRLRNAQRAPAAWMPAATFATSITLALTLTLREPTGLPDISIDPAAASFVFAGDDAELAEELEFYRWLESRGHAG